MWPRALLTVALRAPAPALLFTSVAGWMTLAWLLADDGHDHSPSRFATIWIVMIGAMAPPLLVREVGRLWRASLRRLRHVTVVSFICGYVGVWLLAGVPLALLSGWFSASAERVALAAVLVALWHCTPARQRWLNACHRAPTLRVFGMPALGDSLRYGVATGSACVATCGPAMLLVLLVGRHHLGAMTIAMLWVTVERYAPPRRPRWRMPFLADRSFDWPDLAVATRAPL